MSSGQDDMESLRSEHVAVVDISSSTVLDNNPSNPNTARLRLRVGSMLMGLNPFSVKRSFQSAYLSFHIHTSWMSDVDIISMSVRNIHHRKDRPPENPQNG